MAIEASEELEIVSDSSMVGTPDDGTDATEATYSAWYKLVKEHTKQQLTSDNDHLPAVAASAKRFHAQLGDQYFAGLWRGDLLQGLLWGVVARSKGRGPPGSPLLRTRLRLLGYYEYQDNTAESASNEILPGFSSEHRAPSWSWAGAKPGVELSWPTEFYRGPFTYPAKVVSVEVRSKPGDDFGSVEGGELVLEAPYRHLHLWLGSYSGSLSNPASLVLRALTRLGRLPRTRKLAQLVLTRPHFLASTPSSRSVAAPRSSTRFTLI